MTVSLSKPTVGGDSGTWGTKLNQCLTDLETGVNAVETSVTGLAFGAPTSLDSDDNAMVKAHAYKVAQDGFVVVYSVHSTTQTLNGYIGSTPDPAGAGTLVAKNSVYSASTAFISFPVQSGKYFEITIAEAATVTIQWFPVGTLQKPVDYN